MPLTFFIRGNVQLRLLVNTFLDRLCAVLLKHLSPGEKLLSLSHHKAHHYPVDHHNALMIQQHHGWK